MNSDLIKKAKSSPEAFGEIYELLYEEVYKYVYFRVKSQEISEDLVSVIWEKVLFSLPTFQSNHPIVFKVWLFRITRNVLYNHYRYRSKEVTFLLEETDFLHPENFIENVKNKELNKELIQLLGGLPENEREIVSLKFFSDFKNKEIAKILDISEQMVGAYLSRALKTLRSKSKFLL